MYRRNGRGRLLLLVLLALSIVVITLDFRQNEGGPLERAKDISAAMVAPIQRGFTAVTRPVGNFFSSLAELGDLRGENNQLRDENVALEGRINEAERVIDENARLRALLELDESWVSMEPIHASVISVDPSNYKWAVTIDKGRADGVKLDMAVLSPDGLVGKVIRSSSSTATVLLLIDPNAGARARVEGGRDTGIVRGNGASERLSLELVGPNAAVEEGDDIVTAGFDGGIFPPGIPIGVVAEVSANTSGVDKGITVEPFVRFNGLDFVAVLPTGSQLDSVRGPRVSRTGTPADRVGDTEG